MKTGRIEICQEEIFEDIQIEYVADDVMDFEDSDF